MRDGMSSSFPAFPFPAGVLTTHVSEQSIIDTFAKIWNTHNLLVSFDGMNLTLPSPDLKPSTPWPHVDQNPNRKGMQCVQGILNLAPNGPDDGGLVVLKGSHRQNEAFFKTHPETEGAGTWGSADWHGFNEEEVSWFQSRGCEEVKVCAGPGGKLHSKSVKGRGQ
jgi:hypothetical protein